MPRWVPPVLAIVVIGVLVAVLDLGRRGERSPDTDDAHWFGGIFYFNRDDKRILVPKRFGFGFGRTLNFAHPVSWGVVLVPLLLAALGAARRG